MVPAGNKANRLLPVYRTTKTIHHHHHHHHHHRICRYININIYVYIYVDIFSFMLAIVWLRKTGTYR